MAREYWPREWCAWPSRRFIATVKGMRHVEAMSRDRAQLALGRPDGMLVVAHPPGRARVVDADEPAPNPSRFGRSLPCR